MKAPKATSAEIGHSSYILQKAEARLSHQKRLMKSMAGSFDPTQTAEAEKLVTEMNDRLIKLRADHETLIERA